MKIAYLAMLAIAVLVILSFVVQPARPEASSSYAKGYQVQFVGKQWRI